MATLLPPVTLAIGRETFPLEPVNTVVRDARTFRLICGRLYLVAEVYVAHDAACPARLPDYNEASGPCTCGGQAAFDALLKGAKSDGHSWHNTRTGRHGR